MRDLGVTYFWAILLGGLLLVGVLSSPPPAAAIPLFAHEYGVTCEKCHTVIPHLNEFGAAFMAEGYRIPGVQPGPAFPLSAKLNLVDSSENQGAGPSGQELPKAIVDEIEAFTAGAIGTRASYLVEQYAVDGGEHGLLRDAWVIDHLNPWDARIPVQVQAGSFTLPLPVDPETFRDTYADYAPYVQTVGTNPFNFFDPKVGVRVGIGDPLQGPSGQIFVGPGHDRQSGIPSTGIDVMASFEEQVGPLAATVFRYSGVRSVVLGRLDAFERTGYGLTWNQWGQFSIENVLMTGFDSDCGAAVSLAGCASSGGFTQLRYQFSRRFFAESRYEGTSDSIGTFARDGVLLLGYGPTENTRVTVEEVVSHVPQTTHTFNAQFSIAY